MIRLVVGLNRAWLASHYRSHILMSILVVFLLFSIGIILSFGYLSISWSEILRIIWSSVSGECTDCSTVHSNIILNVRI